MTSPKEEAARGALRSRDASPTFGGQREGADVVKKILVPVDFGMASKAALRYATRLADTLRAAGLEPSLEVLHCYEIPAMTGPDGSVLVGPEAAADISDRAQEQLDDLAARECATELPVTKTLSQGPVAELILARAQEISADLIVIGTHGRRGLERFLLGSVAEQVLRGAEVPVLTVRPKADS